MAAIPLRIDLGSSELLDQIIALGSGDVLKCYQCGTCVGDCPATIDALHVRRLMKLAIYGLDEPLKGDAAVWSCTTCHQCSERCPEGASPTELVMAIRRLQSQEGMLPEAIRRICLNILANGHAIEVEDKHKKARKAVGLPELPPTALSHPEALEEIKAIVESRGLAALKGRGGEG